MGARGKVWWLILLGLAGVFSLAYLYFTLRPGPADPRALVYFTPEELARARLYQQGQRLLFLASFWVQAGFLSWAVLGGAAQTWSAWALQASGQHYYAAALVFFLLLFALLQALALPLDLAGFYWARHWGLVTQSLAGWGLDHLQGLVLNLAFSATGVLLLFWLFRLAPHRWWALAGLGLAGWLAVSALLWPALIAPLFNRFEPVRDPQVLAMVERLSRATGLEVDQVLVMDASRRGTTANAYFAGLGPTKRIVFYDTLLADYPLPQVEAVLAHEMAHWRHGDVCRGLFLQALAGFLGLGLLALLLRASLGPPTGAGLPPQAWALILLFGALVSFLSLPAANAYSRGHEARADRTALELTGRPAAFVELQAALARQNLADVSPPAFIEWFSYSHPATLKRIYSATVPN